MVLFQKFGIILYRGTERDAKPLGGTKVSVDETNNPLNGSAAKRRGSMNVGLRNARP